MIKKIEVDRIYLSNAIPFYGTELHEQAKKDGLFIDIDLKELHLNSDMHLSNYDRYFIKPYALELSDLKDFRRKFNKLIKSKK